MDLGLLELQDFANLLVVLGVALIALLCDYLKGNNDQLRERNIELRALKFRGGGGAWSYPADPRPVTQRRGGRIRGGRKRRRVARPKSEAIGRRVRREAADARPSPPPVEPAAETVSVAPLLNEIIAASVTPAAEESEPERTVTPPLAESAQSVPDLLPLYSDLTWEVAAVDEAPIEAADLSLQNLITAVRDESAVSTDPDLLLPPGMHDLSTWIRLLSLPNPMSGILFTITLPQGEIAPPAENGPAIENLMASFLRDGDFGARIADNTWIFIYSNDKSGLNQRRVETISEKIWDFKLRHLEMANANFMWGAVDVKSGSLEAAADAARESMNQSHRPPKLSLVND